MDLKFWLGYASEWLGVAAVVMIAGVSPMLKRIRQIEFRYPRREAGYSLTLYALTYLVAFQYFSNPIFDFIKNLSKFFSGGELAERMILAVICLIPFLLAMILRGQPLKSIGWGKENLKAGAITGFLLVMLTLVLRGKFLTLLSGVNQEQANLLLVWALLALAEETIFRGYIQLRLTTFFGFHLGIPGNRGAIHAVAASRAHLDDDLYGTVAYALDQPGFKPSCWDGSCEKADMYWLRLYTALPQAGSYCYSIYSIIFEEFFMRMSRLVSQTLREAPAESEIISHQLLVRAGFIRQLGAGIFSALPLGYRSLNRIMNIMREEINAIGGQEISMPVVQPADIWKESGRYYQIGSEMGRFKDKSDHDMILAMTHEEVVTDLARGLIRSYKQLPVLVYQLQTKWRDDPRPRAGLIRVREFTMLDSYSLDADWDGLDKQYDAHYDAYFRIFERCGLPVVAVMADTGMMGGKMAHEYMYLTPIGEDSLLFCDACGYSANRQVARAIKPVPIQEDLLPVEKVATPDCSSIADLAALLKIPTSKTAKAVFFMADIQDEAGSVKHEFVFAVVRGDMEVNETKITNLLKAKELRPATDEEIARTGAIPGYASPIGLKKVHVIVDELIPNSPNLVAGANEKGYHLLNVNYGRDFEATQVADITSVSQGDACEKCGKPYRLSRGVEVGNIFKLGTRYTDSLDCTFTDENHENHSIIMGSYGIGVGRLLACIAEEHHDEKGLIWPKNVAPYPIHLVVLPGKQMDVTPVVEQLERALVEAGLEPLVDDRLDSAGIKFNDADLIGLPLRVTVSERALKNGGLEVKRRSGGEAWIIPLENAVDDIREILLTLP